MQFKFLDRIFELRYNWRMNALIIIIIISHGDDGRQKGKMHRWNETKSDQ